MSLYARRFLALKCAHRVSIALTGQRLQRVKQMGQPLSLNQRRSQSQQSNLARSSRQFRRQQHPLLMPSQPHTSLPARRSIIQGRTQPRTSARHTSQPLQSERQQATNP